MAYTLDESYLHQSQYDYQQKADNAADSHYQNGYYVDWDSQAEDGVEEEHDDDCYDRVDDKCDRILDEHKQ
jgi:hypothetical protein